MPDFLRITELQDKAVYCFAQAVKEEWHHLVVSFEIEDIDGESTQDTLALSFRDEEGQWKRSSFSAPRECCKLLADLSVAMTNEEGRTWGSCTLQVDSSGKYRYSFSHEPPKRLNGVFDDEALLKNYVPQPI